MMLSTTTKYLFDTNIFIEYLRGNERVKQVMYECRFVAQGYVYYSVISDYELWVGISGMRTETQHTQVLRYFTPKPLTRTILRKAGFLFQPYLQQAKRGERGIPSPFDCMIAATALVYDMTVVSSNVRDFRVLGCRVIEGIA